MIVRASRRKEEEIDFEDKRFNLGVEDDTSRHSRTSHNSRDSSNSPLDNRYDDDEYERRRRLAFESAPWNNDEPIRSAETYRDPWRRSKSPPSGPKFRRPIPGSRSGSKRSHSMSSISASGSDSSEFSGSEGSSFSESSASNLSERSGGRRRFNRKIMEKKKDLSQPNEQRFNKKGITNPNWTKTVEPNRDEREYDSWSESLSESESISSYYSGSNSDSDVSNDSDPKGKQRIPKRPLSNSKKDSKVGLTSQKRSGIDQSDGPPNKKNKFTARSGTANAPLSPLLSTKSAKIESTQTLTEKSEPPKKSPIKMTFMKKHSNLKKDNRMTAKLNGGRDNEVEPELIVEEEEDSLNMSVGLSPKLTSKSISSSSPVSQEALTPPQQPLQQTPSSSSSGGSSKHDKQSLSATVSRREELLQQLRAVEDAIARKRSKIN
jgi:nuclear protein NHN1